MSHFYTIKEDGTHTTIVKKSEFICYLKRISSEDEAKQWIQSIKKEHRKARHHCYAYVIGEHNTIQHSSDDGEPSGTAGVPILEVLKNKNLHNVLAVVVRYFGGIKLGTGGLIRAYGSSVSEAVAHVGRVEKRLQQSIQLTTDYTSHGKLDYFFQTHTSYTVTDTLFTDTIEWIVSIDKSDVTLFDEHIQDLLNGQVTIEHKEEHYCEIPID